MNFYVSTWQKLRFVSFLFSTLIKTASNHIFMCQERRKSLVFVSKIFMFHMRWKYFLYIFIFLPTKIWYHFSRYCFLCLLPFSYSHLLAYRFTHRKKVLFHFLMHGKSNGSRHFYAPSIQHQINMKFMLRSEVFPSSPLNDIPSVYSTSKRIFNAILTCVFVKY